MSMCRNDARGTSSDRRRDAGIQIRGLTMYLPGSIIRNVLAALLLWSNSRQLYYEISCNVFVQQHYVISR